LTEKDFESGLLDEKPMRIAENFKNKDQDQSEDEEEKTMEDTDDEDEFDGNL
jgi:hypothetical protein